MKQLQVVTTVMPVLGPLTASEGDDGTAGAPDIPPPQLHTTTPSVTAMPNEPMIFQLAVMRPSPFQDFAQQGSRYALPGSGELKPKIQYFPIRPLKECRLYG